MSPGRWVVRGLAPVVDSLFMIGFVLWMAWSRHPPSRTGTIIYVILVTVMAIGLEQIGQWGIRHAMADHAKVRTAGAPRLSWWRVTYLAGVVAAMLGSFIVAVTLVNWLGPFLTSLTAGR
jgi:hypothetical protein